MGIDSQVVQAYSIVLPAPQDPTCGPPGSPSGPTRRGWPHGHGGFMTTPLLARRLPLALAANIGLLAAWIAAVGLEGGLWLAARHGVATELPGASAWTVSATWASSAASLVSVGVIALSAATVVLCRRPSPGWPNVVPAAWLLALLPAFGGLIAFFGVLLGISASTSVDGFAAADLWAGLGGFFLPVVAVAEALLAGSKTIFARRTTRDAVVRAAVLVAAAHGVWLAFEVVSSVLVGGAGAA